LPEATVVTAIGVATVPVNLPVVISAEHEIEAPNSVETAAYGPLAPAPPAYAVYARAEQVPTKCPHKHETADIKRLVSGLCIRKKARKTPVLGGGEGHRTGDLSVLSLSNL
jgi:hypothetical protein